MSTGEWLSLVINTGVGIYLAHFYPRLVQRRFPGRVPPLFAGLAKVLRPLGWLLVAGSLAYAVVQLSGA